MNLHGPLFPNFIVFGLQAEQMFGRFSGNSEEFAGGVDHYLFVLQHVSLSQTQHPVEVGLLDLVLLFLRGFGDV